MWPALLLGLKAFLHWEVYVVGLGYLAYTVGPSYLFDSSREDKAARRGCLFYLFKAFLDISAMYCFILILAPILLGISHDASWLHPFRLIADDPVFVVEFLLLVILLCAFLNWLPIIRQLPFFSTFVLGVFTLVYFSQGMVKSGQIRTRVPLEFIPGGWEIVCLVLLYFFCVHFGAFLTILTVSISKNRKSSVAPAIGLHVFSGLIPVIVYGAWLGNQIAP